MSFLIKLEPNGSQFQVDSGETILAAALRHNVELESSCRSGFCGTCIVELLHGDITYPNGKPPALTGQPPNLCLPCQAVPLSDVSLCTTIAAKLDASNVAKEFICKVESYQELSHDVVGLKLRLAGSEKLNFLAGQYIEVILDDEQRRCFSIANAPFNNAGIELQIRRVPGGHFTQNILPNLSVGKSLRINAPLGNFTLRNTERPLLFIAGGTGFSPIKALIEQALKDNPQRSIQLYWGVRSRRDVYLPELPKQWAKAFSTFKFVPVLSEPDADWQGRRGFVHQVVVADHADLSGFEAYLAGPPVMVNAASAALAALGLKAENIFADVFAYAAIKT